MALLVMTLTATCADAYVYWANSGGGKSIGRASLDGSGANRTFITDVGAPQGLAADREHIYWADLATDTIGRANLDGTQIRPTYITGAEDPKGVAVDRGHIYWANLGTNSIARANLDGSDVRIRFIDGVSYPQGVAVTTNYLFWSDTTSTIGRASVDGTSIDHSFVTGARSPDLMDAYGRYLYWSNQQGAAIGRASLTGTLVDQTFVAGATKPLGIAAGDGGIYWANNGTGTIGHANLDGSLVTPSFIPEARAPIGIVVDAEADTTPPNTRIIHRPRHDRARRVEFAFRSSEPSTFECKLDGRRWRRCQSPRRIRHLDPGKHVFKVRATDTAGNVDRTPAWARFTVTAKRPRLARVGPPVLGLAYPPATRPRNRIIPR